MSQFIDRLEAAVNPHLTLSRAQLQALEAHYALLTRWNARLNLTAVRTLEESVNLHYAECLLFGKLLADRWPDIRSVADVGSGAGFPGFPLAVLHPHWAVTLVESHRRKAVFLSEAAAFQSNIRVLAKRGEEVCERFDTVVSRAVTPDDVLALPLSDRFAFLVVANDVPRGTPAVSMPWGTNRCAMFHVKHPPTG